MNSSDIFSTDFVNNLTVNWANQDPIALSYASYRLYREGRGQYHELSSLSPTDDDCYKAIEIRKYYTDRLIVNALKNKKISEFRSKLGAFLVGNYQLKHNELGLLYRLPYFYAEDIFIDKLVTETDCVDNEPRQYNQTWTVTSLGYFLSSRRTGDCINFAFKNSKNQPIIWTVALKNPLLSLVRSINSAPQSQLALSAKPVKFWAHDHNYWSIYDVKLNIDHE